MTPDKSKLYNSVNLCSMLANPMEMNSILDQPGDICIEKQIPWSCNSNSCTSVFRTTLLKGTAKYIYLPKMKSGSSEFSHQMVNGYPDWSKYPSADPEFMIIEGKSITNITGDVNQISLNINNINPTERYSSVLLCYILPGQSGDTCKAQYLNWDCSTMRCNTTFSTIIIEEPANYVLFQNTITQGTPNFRIFNLQNDDWISYPEYTYQGIDYNVIKLK